MPCHRFVLFHNDGVTRSDKFRRRGQSVYKLCRRGFVRHHEFFANGEKTVEKIKKAVPSMKKIYIEDIDDEKKLGEAIAGSDLLINATRAGMSPLENVLPVPEELLHKDLAVADVVYNPRETLLIKKAKEGRL